MRSRFVRRCAGLVTGRLRALAVLPALALIALMSGLTPIASANSGVVSAMNGFGAESLPWSQMDLQVAAMQLNGVQVVRADAPWANIQPQPPGPNGPGYQWSQTDTWVMDLAVHHMTWEPVIDYSVGWDKNCTGFCAPTGNTYYADFAQAVAARYGEHGTFWSQHPFTPYYPVRIFEIWNEENVPTYHIDPGRYASLYAAARVAIHAVQPSASVIVGGLGDDGGIPFNASQDYAAEYVQQMFAADPQLRGNIDGFGLHPYGTSGSDVENWTIDFRKVLDTLGEGSVPIDVTEFGWSTGDTNTENWRAWQMNTVGYTLGRSNCGIRLLAPYTWVSPGATTPNDFGLVDSSGLSTVLRLAGSTWFKALTGAATESQLALCP